ncbi:ArdC family protein [Cryobacterium sp. GrIS_2_6]|uniref:ArdC family protein n=1 Tax=Cryobacterium sp. GrIS_2_6 TaxID=3162785 RepID=UPI002E03746B|nr:antirestriction protein ArdC [Cryobacterium psychrotolerans]
MTELLTNSRPPEKFNPQEVEWAALLETALTMPGALGATYSRFRQYSMGNQIALFMQGATGPVAPYKKWLELGRQVRKGSKAMAVQVPLLYKEANREGLIENKVKGFKWVNSVFELADTDGEDLPQYEPPEWSRERAMGTLGIQQVAFENFNGNSQGYSRGNEIAINPVAAYPFKTTIHEMAHVAMKHTTPEGLAEYQSHRGLMEFGAEGTAYLVMNELNALDQMDAPESRAYIQTWLRGETPDDKAIRQVLATTGTILKAGREQPKEEQE